MIDCYGNSPSTNDRPLVSVVTATLNNLNGLKETVNSVATQGFSNVEHVIVDGGSTDGTLPYLRELGSRVRWISEADKGIADALNKGVAMARGDYVLVLQAEDTLMSGALEKARDHLASPYDIISFNVRIVEAACERDYLSTGFGFASEFFMTIPHQGAFVRKSLYERIGSFDSSFRIAMDYEFMMRAKRFGASIISIPQTLSVMPYTGASAMMDWPHLEKRLAENRKIHIRYTRGFGDRMLKALFWRIYPVYRRLRADRTD